MVGCCEHHDEPCLKSGEFMELHYQLNESVEFVVTYSEL